VPLKNDRAFLRLSHLLTFSDTRTFSLTAFALGAVLDFFLVKYREDLWLWFRIPLFESVSRWRFVSLHRNLARWIVRRIQIGSKNDDIQFIFGSCVAFASLLWIALTASLGHAVASDSQLATVRTQIVILSSLFSIFLLFMIYAYAKQKHHGLADYFADSSYCGPRARKILVGAMVGFVYLVCGIGLAAFCVAILCLLWYAIFPPIVECRIAAFTIFANVFCDCLSVGVTYRLLKRLAYGHAGWSVCAPLLDVISALFFVLLTQFLIYCTLGLVGVLPPGTDPKSGWAVYTILTSISAFVPTFALAFIFLFLLLIKAIFCALKLFTIEFIDLAAPPNDSTWFKPFTAVGAMIAVVLWVIYAGSVLAV